MTRREDEVDLGNGGSGPAVATEAEPTDEQKVRITAALDRIRAKSDFLKDHWGHVKAEDVLAGRISDRLREWLKEEYQRDRQQQGGAR